MEFLTRVLLWLLGHWLMKKGLDLEYIEGSPWFIDQLGGYMQIWQPLDSPDRVAIGSCLGLMMMILMMMMADEAALWSNR